MDNWIEEFQEYLPGLEEFLTSVLLEETNVSVASWERVKEETALEDMPENDVILYNRDEANDVDVLIVLDEEWFGLLSSIMLGIEEKTKNETTVELLEEFSLDLVDMFTKEAQKRDVEVELGETKILSVAEAKEVLTHEEYIWADIDVDGLADHTVRAELFLGDPATKFEIEEEEPEEPEESEEEADEENEEEFSSMISESDKQKTKEEVITARNIEFAEFGGDSVNGPRDDVHSMDLLKDVELDVSVELGRIELPLGKVLQLAKGSVIELEKLAGEPVDILVNGNQIAKGEVVVIDEHFGVRISSLVTTRKRLAGISNGNGNGS